MTQSSPPGYVYLLNLDHYGRAGWPDQDDVDRMQNLPEDAMLSLIEYWGALEAESESPCIWLDMKTRMCKHYEHRPSICRTFPVGEKACREYRQEQGIRGPA